MALNPGDILHIYCVFIKPPKYKFVICVCPVDRLFFFINSKPRRTTPDAQLMIKKETFSFLTRNSYINTATICTFGEHEIDKAEKIGLLPKNIKDKIIDIVRGSRYLAPKHIDIIVKNLSA